MSTHENRTAKIEELRSQLAAAEAEQKAEEKAEQARLRRARRDAGEAHARTMHALYELLDIEPEHPTTRIVRGVERPVTVDRNEVVRSRRLLHMITAILDEADPSLLERLKREDQAGRDERRPKARASEAAVSETGEAASDGPFAPTDDDFDAASSPSAFAGHEMQRRSA